MQVLRASRRQLTNASQSSASQSCKNSWYSMQRCQLPLCGMARSFLRIQRSLQGFWILWTPRKVLPAQTPATISLIVWRIVLRWPQNTLKSMVGAGHSADACKDVLKGFECGCFKMLRFVEKRHETSPEWKLVCSKYVHLITKGFQLRQAVHEFCALHTDALL